jgi:predicted dehydrogenase
VKKSKVGIIGCGKISAMYLQRCKLFEILDVVACADINMKRAIERAKEFNVPKACSVEELLGDSEIEIIVNLTTPQAHAEVNLKALESGKHVYVEKPLATSRAEARKVLEKAREKDLLVGCAPDTFLGGGIQTCRRIIDDGLIGKPIAAVASMVCHGHESWHPDPEFYYKRGGGPLLDMGPYYLTTLVNLIGPIEKVSGSSRISFPERTITSKPKYGTSIKVEIPTHLAGTIDFSSGAIGTIIMSFDVWKHNLPPIEIYGSEGSLCVPDPNIFGGSVKLFKAGDEEWIDIPLYYGYSEDSRGIGVADMAYAIQYGRPHRANGNMAYHVLDVMLALEESSALGKSYRVESSCEKPKALPVGLKEGYLDE